MYDYLVNVFWTITLLLIGLGMAPLLDGFRRKIKAKIQRRIGPPIVQTIYDLRKLFSLQPILPFKNMLLISIPYTVFTIMVILLTAVPVPFVAGFSRFFDIVSLMYVMLLASVFTVILGLMVPNPYSNAGSARELLLITVFETFIALTVIGIAYKIGSLNLYDLAVSYGLPVNYVKPSTLFISLSLFILAYVESAYTPFDIGEAETEVLGGPFLELSGRYYGLLLYSLLLKRYILASIPVSLVMVSPILAILSHYVGGLPLSIISLTLFIIFMLLLASFYSIIEALYPRYRLDLSYKPLLLASLIPFIGFILGWIGW